MDRIGFIDRTAHALRGHGVLRTGWSGCLIALVLCSSLRAESPASMRPSSSLESRQEAMQFIPFDQLTAAKREKIRKVLDRPSVYRRLPIQLTATDPKLFTFLVRYPEVVINMWQLMGATKIKFQRTGPYTFQMDDGAGTSSRVELIYGTPQLHVFYAEGFYDGSLLPRRVQGKCVMVLTTANSEQQGRPLLSSRLDVFLQADRLGVELLAKTLHPLMGSTIDKNYSDTVRFASQVSRATTQNRAGIERFTARLANVDPAIRSRFNKLTVQLNESSRKAPARVARPVPGERSARRQ
ncbi:MAG: hypothetical protein VB877_04900 [Pirellulaceae bacterium]